MSDHQHSSASYMESVSDYRRMIANMLEDARKLSEYADGMELTEVKVRLDEVTNRVENNFFSIAVVGEFKRGKSTLINALLGQEILPADVLPCSATLNRITYGLKPTVMVKFKD